MDTFFGLVLGLFSIDEIKATSFKLAVDECSGEASTMIGIYSSKLRAYIGETSKELTGSPWLWRANRACHWRQRDPRRPDGGTEASIIGRAR